MCCEKKVKTRNLLKSKDKWVEIVDRSREVLDAASAHARNLMAK